MSTLIWALLSFYVTQKENETSFAMRGVFDIIELKLLTYYLQFVLSYL